MTSKMHLKEHQLLFNFLFKKFITCNKVIYHKIIRKYLSADFDQIENRKETDKNHQEHKKYLKSGSKGTLEVNLEKQNCFL